MEKPSGEQMPPVREPTAKAAGLRALSNTSLVEQAGRKALSLQQLERTLERVQKLCVTPGEDAVAELEEAAETLRNAGYRQELMRLLAEALSRPDANPHVGALWMRRVVTSKVWDHRYPQSLDLLCKQGEIGRQAVMEFIEQVGNKRRHRLLLQAQRRHAKWLRTHPKGWAVTGRALVQARCYRQAARWMADWRSQPELDLPTLQSLALALRASHKSSQAEEVIRLALEKPGSEQLPLFKLWQAEAEAFAGKTQEAATTFKLLNPAGWDDDLQAVFYLVRSVIRVEKAEGPARKEAFSMALDRLADLFRRVPVYKRDVFLRQEYRRCVTRMAREAGDWPELVRAFWRSAESRSFILALLLVPGLQLLLPCYVFRLCARRKGVTRRR